MKSLGMRHVALNVKDPQISKKFYSEVLQMTVEWEPDSENVYMTSDGQDNVALHKSKDSPAADENQKLDHIGFFVKEINGVDEWYAHVKKYNVKIVRDIKTHRDGARSFYFLDPDGVVIQILYHIPVSKRA